MSMVTMMSLSMPPEWPFEIGDENGRLRCVEHTLAYYITLYIPATMVHMERALIRSNQDQDQDHGYYMATRACILVLDKCLSGCPNAVTNKKMRIEKHGLG